MTAALLLALVLAQPQPPTTPTTPTPPTTTGAPGTAAQPVEPAKAALALGDPAPAITVEAFLKGEPVTAFEKGRVYAVVFWNRFDPSSVRALPWLNEAAGAYKELTVVAVHTYTRGDSAGRAKAYVDRQGDRIAVRAAFDGEARAMDKAWLTASRRGDLPAAYIVNGEGVLAAVAHPMFVADIAPKVIAGTWDLKADGPRAAKAEDSERRLEALFEKEDFKGVLGLLEEVAKDFPLAAARRDDLKAHCLLALKEYDRAYEVIRRIAELALAAKDATALNQVAWTIVDPDGGVEKKDLDLALKTAEKAVEYSKNQDSSIIDTLARVYFCKGDRARAIELQKEAIEKAPANKRDQFRDTLKEYEGPGGK